MIPDSHLVVSAKAGINEEEEELKKEQKKSRPGKEEGDECFHNL